MSKRNLKTVQEHLMSFPEPFKSQALRNTKHGYILKQKYESPKRALIEAFDWPETDDNQGFKYWWNFYNTI